MTNKPDTKYKIRIFIEGNSLVYNECTLLKEEDNSFIKFSDKFGTIYRYNKIVVISMEELK